MDTKSVYSTGVQNRKALSQTDIDLAGKIAAGHTRKETFGSGWQSVNINEVAAKFAPVSLCIKTGKLSLQTKRAL